MEATVYSLCPLETRGSPGKLDLSAGPETPVVLERNSETVPKAT